MDRAIDEVAAAHGVELLVQFGSTVTGTSHAGSDVDLAVLLREAPDSLDGQASLAAALQRFFPGRDVDLVVLNHADPLLLRQVTDRGVLVAGDRNRWQEFRAYAFRRYQDHRPFLAMERAYVDRVTARSLP